MAADLSAVTIAATKPLGKVARGLADLGVQVTPVDADEGNVDRYVAGSRLVMERRTGGSFLAGNRRSCSGSSRRAWHCEAFWRRWSPAGSRPAGRALM